ncbi:hypothetical protein GOP47_0007910 [Adiantum capillus-veneris]|uniref:DUF1223 domain-containing protein n=1 Tax=Adiantum capillus-veneris TaxID=13818 RepID=A0A9D4ZJ41_ADICA|nr:hypothetical protein GOP47_0007322 [Adiantum capillus-veneris]KAI5078086.1 hypothetical protein GOP47_0007910 [Adiantum capillus-veneris]
MSRFCCCFSGGGSAEKMSKVSSEASNGSTKTAPTTAGQENRSKSSAKGPSPVLVEHFTSQGCSSCPSSDLLLSKLGQESVRGSTSGEDEATTTAGTPPLIVLAYHVDYWDYLGWKDPFANHRWSSRQRAYGEALQQDSIYTPEVVVQGRSHCIGSNEDNVSALIKDAPQFPALDLRVSFKRPSPSDLEMSLSLSCKLKVEGNLDVMVAVFENGQVTDCGKGENRGRVLTNDFIVRSLDKACTLQNGQTKKAQGQVSIKLWDGYSKTKCGMAVFLQNPLTMEVYGAQLVHLPDDI